MIKHTEIFLEGYPYNIYQWFAARDFEFESRRNCNLGDIDIDIFYEHCFSDQWIAELMFGVRIPSGTGDNWYKNAYYAPTGNSGHWEIKLGGMVTWMPLDWFNLKLDGYFSFVLESTERRCATFKGAQIKNIGPAVDADVDWQYLVLRLDTNLFHPKTNDLSATIGYEFYYKTRDDVDFKVGKMESFLGAKQVNHGTENYPEWRWDEYEEDLDSSVIERNTEAIGHKIRLEGSYRATDWFELFVGGSYTFAGQHLPRETDAHGGFTIRF